MNTAASDTTGAPLPVRLRPTTSASIGTTAFFRNRALLNVLLAHSGALDRSELSILIHACSIGAEVWSLLIAADLDERTKEKRFHVDACDVETDFIGYAERGVYPQTILAGMSSKEQTYFEPFGADCVRVCDRLRTRVTFLPARSVAAFETDKTYDIVMLLNALLYLPGELQSQVIDRIAKCNSSFFVTSGFHADRIKSDMQRNRYAPVADHARLIHEGWTDRRRTGPARDETIPGKIYHSWSLPNFSEIEDFEYKYCALFAKREVV